MSLSRNLNDFGFRLLQQLPVDRNCFFSPFSIAMALQGVLAGARERTRQELMDLLRLEEPDSGWLEKASQHWADLVKPSSKSHQQRNERIEIANALFVQKGFLLRKDFLEVMQSYLHSSAFACDFRNATRSARLINDWVERQTSRMIQNLVSPNAVGRETRLVLANAIYFLGRWQTPFPREKTEPRPFYLRPENRPQAWTRFLSHEARDSVEVEMMHLMGHFPYTKDRGCQVLELPYRSRDFSMLILLPRMGRLEETENFLQAGFLNDLAERLSTRKVKVMIPRLELAQTLSLNDALEKLGASTMFTQQADLSGISDDPAGLSVSEIVHRAKVTIDESGTEAAAATAVLMPLSSMRPPLPEIPVVFKADHPYLFLILSRRTGTVLFMGRVVNPLEPFGRS